MKIFVLRHGITDDPEADESRQLTAKGVEEVRAVVTRNLEELSSIEQVLCSPMPRVKHTVELATEMIAYSGEITESENFNTGSRFTEIVAAMSEIRPENGDLLVSSHQSCTSILVLWLTAEDILIPNGSLLAIEANELAYGKGTILWQDSASGREVKRTSNFADQI